MTVNILTGFEKIYEIITGSIKAEVTEKGLLHDVETIVNTYYTEGQVEEPVIWITQHPTSVTKNANIGGTMELQTPFEFDCGVYNTDLEDANLESQNLANRVVLSVLRNWQTQQNELIPGQRMIRSITLNTYSPVGYVNVTNKSDKVPVTGVILNVNHIINWQMCLKNAIEGE